MNNLHYGVKSEGADGLNGFLNSTTQPFQPPPSKIQLGSFVTSDDLNTKFKKEGIQLGYGGESIIEGIFPITGNIKKIVSPVYTTVLQFCFKDQVGKIEIFNRAMRRGWKFISAETAANLRLQYLNQGTGNVIFAPIESPNASEGKYPVAIIENDLGIKMFQGNSDDPNSILFGTNLLVFEICD